MIPELINLYDRLAAADDSHLAPYGYSRQRIGFSIVLNLDGSLHAIEDRRQEASKGKKTILKPVLQLVPGTGGRTSGIAANFLWDQPGYMLGVSLKDSARTAEKFAAFRELHLALENEIDSPEFGAVCRFMESWDPKNLPQKAEECLAAGFGVFQIRGQRQYVHEVPAVKVHWEKNCDGEQKSRAQSQSLVSGDSIQASRLHLPWIKGVRGTNANGAPLVGCNLSAFESYRRTQGDNAPIGDVETFKYCTALNWLSSFQRIFIEDTSFLYWTGAPTKAESLFGLIFNQTPEDNSLKEQLRTGLSKIAKGQLPLELGDPDTQIYVLGLAGAAGRISVRYWHQNTLGDFYTKLKTHFEALGIDPASNPPSLWRLLKETVRRAEEGKKDEEIKPGLAEGLLRSILEGTNYPISVYSAVLGRMRTEKAVTNLKAAIIRAVLTRNYNIMLDHQQIPYRLGRLLAVLERLQLSAVDSSPVNNYFGTASTTPALVFPRLVRGAQPHFASLKSKGKEGLSIYYEKIVQEIVEPITNYPARLNLPEQGLFGLGYFHQRQALFTKSSVADHETVSNKTNKENNK